ncbi:hypothetical protein ABVK25_003511 [Lepraria finkii]|uniref:Uncharacterized protein n=1 Tax=Lepraria finkii TaxID=1340010 RepID=A0ABR4BF59_9LECA
MYDLLMPRSRGYIVIPALTAWKALMDDSDQDQYFDAIMETHRLAPHLEGQAVIIKDIQAVSSCPSQSAYERGPGPADAKPQYNTPLFRRFQPKAVPEAPIPIPTPKSTHNHTEAED